MLSAFVNEKLLVHSTTQAVLRKHTLYGYFYYLIRTAADEALCSFGLLTSRVARVSHILLVFHLVAGKNDLTAVDYYHIISTIEVWSVVGLVLATEYVSNACSHTAKRLVSSVY